MKKITTIFFLLFALLAHAYAQQTNPLWMRYPAISPDGSKIAFTYQGNIYLVDAKGGQAQILTYNQAYETAPVWSPDSKTLAFVSYRYGSADIFTINVTGTTPKRLTFHSGNEMPFSFTPDGKNILFSAAIQDTHLNVQFPSPVLPELYSVPVDGGAIQQVLPTQALYARYNKNQTKILFHDVKGYEDQWRKHHTSSVTRDIWLYDVPFQKYTQLTKFKGEDRHPLFSNDEKTVFFLTEQFNATFNIASFDVDNPDKVTQITKYQKHPVRFLTIANNQTLCYSFHGEIYTLKPGQEPQKVHVNLFTDYHENEISFTSAGSRVSEMNVSPSGKEVAFVIRGEVFVTSVEYGTTKRITNTPEQERSVSFSPDGKKLLYAAERNGSWNLYEAKIDDDSKQFVYATKITETALLEIPEETFQPAYSPNGKEVAFLQERTELKVINLQSKEIRSVVAPNYNYSYSDGDQWYQWAPDSKWFLINYTPDQIFSGDVGLVSAQGGKIINLTPSGYQDARPKWSLKGKAMIWQTDKHGMRSHGSWGAQDDVYALFFEHDAYNQFKMSKEEYSVWKQSQTKPDDDSDDDKKKKKKKQDNESTDLNIDLTNFEDRMIRLTRNAANISDAILTPDGQTLFYMARFENGFDLWKVDVRKKETSLVTKLKGGGGAMQFDNDAKNLFLISGGKIMKFDVKTSKKENISFNAQMNLNKAAERNYLFEHAWRQMKKKFYKKDLHGVDWDFYKNEYAKFLPHINNNFDFAEMLSEMLGELNASHTGSGHRFRDPQGDNTASLALFFDWTFSENGIKISEVIDKSPLLKASTNIKPGMVIQKINGININNNQDYFKALNRKAGTKILLTVFDPNSNNTFETVVQPISRGEESQLLYERWVKTQRNLTDKYSNGRLGYVHVRGMNSASFREVYSEVLGRYFNKEAIVIDTRFNGGGWLHDDLATLFSGEKYVDFVPRGQEMGRDPMSKWNKPSILLVSESNYSDAHAFPFVYQTLKIGKIVGMPVPGTMTAVWWETLQDPTLYFGIPQVGARDMNGDFLENKQLNPDVIQPLDFEKVIKGEDQQLKKAVEVMLEDLKQ